MKRLEELKKHDSDYIATHITYLFHKKCNFPWFVMGSNRNNMMLSEFDFYLIIKKYFEEDLK